MPKLKLHTWILVLKVLEHFMVISGYSVLVWLERLSTLRVHINLPKCEQIVRFISLEVLVEEYEAKQKTTGHNPLVLQNIERVIGRNDH